MFIHKYKDWLVEKQLDLFSQGFIHPETIKDFFVEIEDILDKSPKFKYGVSFTGQIDDFEYINEIDDNFNLGKYLDVYLTVYFNAGLSDSNSNIDIKKHLSILKKIANRISSHTGRECVFKITPYDIIFIISCGNIHIDEENFLTVLNIRNIIHKDNKCYFEMSREDLWDCLIGYKNNTYSKQFFIGEFPDDLYDSSFGDITDWDSLITYNLSKEQVSRIITLLIKEGHIEETPDDDTHRIFRRIGYDSGVLTDIMDTYRDMYFDDYYVESEKKVEQAFEEILDDVVEWKMKDDKYLIRFEIEKWSKYINSQSPKDIFNEYIANEIGRQDISPNFPDYASVDSKTFCKEVDKILDSHEKRS